MWGVFITTTQAVKESKGHDEHVVLPSPQPTRVKIIVPILNLPKIACSQDIDKFLSFVDSFRDTWGECETKEGYRE